MKQPKKKSGKIYNKIEKKIVRDAQGGRVVSFTSRIRAIGNSQGIILNNNIMEAAELTPKSEVNLQVENGVITIRKTEINGVNTDLSTWDKHFESAIKKGALPEQDFFESITNQFDKKEW